MKSSQIPVYLFRGEQDAFVDKVYKECGLVSVILDKGAISIDSGKFIGKRTARYLVSESSLNSVVGIGDGNVAIDVSRSPIIEVERSTLERRGDNIYLYRGRIYAVFEYYLNGEKYKKSDKFLSDYKKIKNIFIKLSIRRRVYGSIVYTSFLSDRLIRSKGSIVLR